MRTIGVVTAARSDYGIYLPVLRRIQSDPELRLRVFVTGMHLSAHYGHTVDVLEADGIEVGDRVEMLLATDTPEGIGKSMGLGTIGFAQSFGREQPDILLVLGDRFEMHAAVVAALPYRIPVAHVHGGEVTEGAFDESLRHSISKMSHLHFAATEVYAQRLIRMGEEPWRVLVSGAPSLDHLHDCELLSAQELQASLSFDLRDPVLLVTYHPVTLEPESTEVQLHELLAALAGFPDATVVITYPNADTGSHGVIRMIEAFAAERPNAFIVVSMGTRRYFSMMGRAAAMVGNSSSGIIEAASFALPVVNVGDRQRGRVRAKNVVDAGCTRGEIEAGIETALSPSFRAGLSDTVNPYGDGHAAERIVGRLKQVELGAALITKRFHDG